MMKHPAGSRAWKLRENQAKKQENEPLKEFKGKQRFSHLQYFDRENRTNPQCEEADLLGLHVNSLMVLPALPPLGPLLRALPSPCSSGAGSIKHSGRRASSPLQD